MITLATLPQATEQEIFDQVVVHLITQGRRSVSIIRSARRDPNVMCRYLSPEGLKCAAGCLIGDSEYSPEMENASWAGLAVRKVVPNIHERLISDLQIAHDGWGEDSTIVDSLLEVAVAWNLNPSIVLTTLENLE